MLKYEAAEEPRLSREVGRPGCFESMKRVVFEFNIKMYSPVDQTPRNVPGAVKNFMRTNVSAKRPMKESMKKSSFMTRIGVAENGWIFMAAEKFKIELSPSPNTVATASGQNSEK